MVFYRIQRIALFSNIVHLGTSADSEIKTDVKEESENEEEEESLPQPENDTTLFIKNLNFTTTEDILKTVSSSTCRFKI